MDSLEGQVAIVTGGNQGIGLAIVRGLCQAGASVAIADITVEKGYEIQNELEEQGFSAIFYPLDVRHRNKVQSMADDLLNRFGHIDVLVNNAGIPSGGLSEEVSEAEWEKVLSTNLSGVMVCSQIIGRVMLKQHSGSIVNICSIAGVGGWAKRACYTPSKAAVISLTQVLGVEWAKYNVRVNGINPGQIETPLNEIMFEQGLADRETFTNRAPMRRFGSPEEIAEVVLFLASDESSYITAEVITVDGGWLAWGGFEPTNMLDP
jgi:NAD(P)-dependent dehydrogenase (short-subunit alcohol dehydrogenase family)